MALADVSGSTRDGPPVHQLLMDLSPERFGALYEALPAEVIGALDTPIASVLNSRVAKVRKRPLPMKLKALRAFLLRQRDDDLALEMLRGYLLGPRADLVKDFLDATGVPHEDGQINDEDSDEPAEPDPKKVPGAIKTLTEKHDPDDVRLYLEIAAMQWPEHEAVRKALVGLRDAN